MVSSSLSSLRPSLRRLRRAHPPLPPSFHTALWPTMEEMVGLHCAKCATGYSATSEGGRVLRGRYVARFHRILPALRPTPSRGTPESLHLHLFRTSPKYDRGSFVAGFSSLFDCVATPPTKTGGKEEVAASRLFWSNTTSPHLLLSSNGTLKPLGGCTRRE